jgi:hypothetical protein
MPPGGPALAASGNGAQEAALNLGFRLCADDPVDFMAGLQDQQRGNTLDPEALRRERVVVDVHSCELNAPGHFRGELIENRSDGPAGAAPGRPHIEEDGERRALDLREKGRVGDVDRMAEIGGLQRGFASTANRSASSDDFLNGDAVRGVARGTTK